MAKTLKADIRFLCGYIVLRRFDDARKQYDIYKRFAFGEGWVIIPEIDYFHGTNK